MLSPFSRISHPPQKSTMILKGEELRTLEELLEVSSHEPEIQIRQAFT